MPNLSVAVDGHDIMVWQPNSALSVTYRRQGRVLVALNPMRNDPAPEELNFLVKAWRAVFAEAQSLGWLYYLQRCWTRVAQKRVWVHETGPSPPNHRCPSLRIRGDGSMQLAMA